MQYFSSMPPASGDPHEHSVESIIGQMITYRLMANDAVKLLQPQCRKQPAGPCTDLVRAETAAEVWHAAVQLMTPLLQKRRKP